MVCVNRDFRVFYLVRTYGRFRGVIASGGDVAVSADFPVFEFVFWDWKVFLNDFMKRI